LQSIKFIGRIIYQLGAAITETNSVKTAELKLERAAVQSRS